MSSNKLLKKGPEKQGDMCHRQANSNSLQLTKAKTSDNSIAALFLSKVAALSKAETFIESGTFKGDTTILAAKIFRQVHSIELSSQLHSQAVRRFQGKKNVTLHFGDSTAVLPEILKSVKGRSLFWLDGHYSDGPTAKGEKNTPIIEELEAIKDAGLRDFFLLIDDIRFFQQPAPDLPQHPTLSGYPTIGQLYDKIVEVDSDLRLAIIGDIAFAYPKEAGLIVSRTIKACTVSRLYDELGHVSVEHVLDAEQNILAQAVGDELEALQDLHKMYALSEQFGAGGHYRLWYALTLAAAERHPEACEQFLSAIKAGLTHWRVKYYLASSMYLCGRYHESSRYLAEVMASAPGFSPAKLFFERTGSIFPPSIDTDPATPGKSGHEGPPNEVAPDLPPVMADHCPSPLRLHLGCGEQYLEGYLNIDYPSSNHSVMQVRADRFADIATLSFPQGSVEEIRLHHVFEHFPRVTALDLLIRWHEWLKPGGKLIIETPDLEGSAKILVSNLPWRVKAATVRHLAGDQADTWAYHVDHWFPERFRRTLSALGFRDIETTQSNWPHEPYLANVTVVATKGSTLTRNHLIQAADQILLESTVSPAETTTFSVWQQQLRDFLSAGERPKPLLTSADTSFEPHIGSRLPLEEIHDFNQRARDRWVADRAATVEAGAFVLDIGAGTCPYRSLFSHCEYKAHDFKLYAGEKLGGTDQYGHIDYVSEITSIPVPDASFDLILCTEVLEHVPEPGLALREMTRILRPGGRIFLTAPLGCGLHQLPYHYYGGFTPQWYRYQAAKTDLSVVAIVPNGGFFRLLAQECARAARLASSCPDLTAGNTGEMRQLLSDRLPRFFFALEDDLFVDQFTVGYHVELQKPSVPGAAEVSGRGGIVEKIMRLKQAHFEDLTK